MRDKTIHDIETSIRDALGIDRVIIDAIEFDPETVLSALSATTRTTLRLRMRVVTEPDLTNSKNSFLGR